MGQRAPGTCADCGNDAYIRVAGHDDDAEMVCAQCFAVRLRAGKAPNELPAPSPIVAHAPGRALTRRL